MKEEGVIQHLHYKQFGSHCPQISLRGEAQLGGAGGGGYNHIMSYL